MDEENAKENKTVWILLGILGLIFIILGALINNHLLLILNAGWRLIIGDIFYGIGVSFFTVMISVYCKVAQAGICDLLHATRFLGSRY